MVYTASDGKEFEKKSDYRKYEMKLCYTFSNLNNSTQTKNPGENNDDQSFDLLIHDLMICR